MTDPKLTKKHWFVLYSLIEQHLKFPKNPYLSIWHLNASTGIEGGAGVPGPMAGILADLQAWGLIRELPDLRHRYRIAVEESTGPQAGQNAPMLPGLEAE